MDVTESWVFQANPSGKIECLSMEFLWFVTMYNVLRERYRDKKKKNTLQTLKYLCFSCSSVSQFKMPNNGCKSKKPNTDQPQILTFYRNLNILKMEPRQNKEHLSVGLHNKTDWQKKGGCGTASIR